MRRLFAVNLILALLAAPALAQVGGKGSTASDHSTAARGGTTIRPRIISLQSGGSIAVGTASTESVSGLLQALPGSTVSVLGMSNLNVMISSGDFQGTTLLSTFTPTITFGVSIASRSCWVDFQSVSTAAVLPVFYFGGDLGAKYTYTSSNDSGLGGHLGSSFANNIAAPLYLQHYSSTAQVVTANKWWTARISLETLAGNLIFDDVALMDTAWNAGFMDKQNVHGTYTPGATGLPGSITFAMSHSNSIDLTGAITRADGFNGMHWEFWCKGFVHQ